MRRMLVTGIAVFAALAVWANAAGAGLFSSTGPVIAILAGSLFLGEAVGHFDGSGTIRIQSRVKPDVTCRGRFTSSAALGGLGQMRCSDGATATFYFQRLSVYSGYGGGNFSRGSMSFAYGLTAEEAGPYLKLPAGKRLTHNGTELELLDL